MGKQMEYKGRQIRIVKDRRQNIVQINDEATDIVGLDDESMMLEAMQLVDKEDRETKAFGASEQ